MGMIEWRLYINNKFTRIVVRPDEKYPNMFRVHWHDGYVSDVKNLVQAKDAAMRYAGRPGGSTGERLKWKAAEMPSKAR
jgi:hypothetical protein